MSEIPLALVYRYSKAILTECLAMAILFVRIQELFKEIGGTPSYRQTRAAEFKFGRIKARKWRSLGRGIRAGRRSQ